MKVNYYDDSNQTNSIRSELGSEYIHYDRLKQYLRVIVNVEHYTKGKENEHLIIDYRHCKKEDFTINKYYKEINHITHYLCPEYESLKEYIRLKNSYISNADEKISFSIQIVKCSNS